MTIERTLILPMRFLLLTSYFSLLTFIFSCRQDFSEGTLPNATGKSGEVIVVMEENIWMSDAGKSIRGCLGAEHPALPQPEPLFSLIQIPHNSFKGLFKTHRNIILIAKSDQSAEPSLIIKHDIWAKGQLVVALTYSTEQEVVALFDKSCNQIVEKINRLERMRITAGYEKLLSENIISMLGSKHAIKLTVPQGYKVVKSDSVFTWLKRESVELNQGIFIYTIPYMDSEVADEQRIRAILDSVCRVRVPGPSGGSYMITVPDLPLMITKLRFKKFSALEVRGLWQVQNEFMGGPFIALIIFDKNNHRVFFLQGYVFAPKFEKREFLRQVEAIVYSLDV